uniref:Uncharacterized protein n=1 Tax=Arundo donax TaxID=35708 RepID=A0A0A9EI15_ARUDO
MAFSKRSRSHTPSIDLINSSNAGGTIQSDMQPQIIDPRERKRQRERSGMPRTKIKY